MVPERRGRRGQCRHGAVMRSNAAEKPGPRLDRSSSETLYDRLGGRECLERVHRRLYDKLFAHAVFGAFFVEKDQQYQEDQQSDFLASQFGGPRLYRGRLPETAHPHLFITDEHFEMRHEILGETLDECGVAPELRDQWLAVDRGFKNRLVKKTVEECEKRFTTDKIIVAPGT